MDRKNPIFEFTEPTGQIAPRKTGDGWNKLTQKIGDEIALICDAQAFPVPLMR